MLRTATGLLMTLAGCCCLLWGPNHPDWLLAMYLFTAIAGIGTLIGSSRIIFL